MAWLPIPILEADADDAARTRAGALVAWVLYRTPLGLAVRMVGENPAAAEGPGLDVNAVYRRHRLRLGADGRGRAFLTLSAFSAFFFNMVNGRGWICGARRFRELASGQGAGGALLFAFFDALQLRLQQGGGEGILHQVCLMLPYVLSILALVLVARRATYPERS